MAKDSPLHAAYKAARRTLIDIAFLRELADRSCGPSALPGNVVTPEVFSDCFAGLTKRLAQLERLSADGYEVLAEARLKLPQRSPTIAFSETSDFAIGLVGRVARRVVSWFEKVTVDADTLPLCQTMIRGQISTIQEVEVLLETLRGEYRDAVRVLGLNESKRPSMKIDEANVVAEKLAAKGVIHTDNEARARDWAKAIKTMTGKTCSLATVQDTPLWIDTMAKTGRGRTKGKTPRAVALTSKMEATIGKDGPEVMEELIAAEAEAAEERHAAIEAVQQSGMTPDQQEATLERLAKNEMTPEQVKQSASLFPPTRTRLVKPFGRV